MVMASPISVSINDVALVEGVAMRGANGWGICISCFAFFVTGTNAQPVDPDFDRQWYLDNTGQVVSGAVGVPGADVDVISAWSLFDGVENVTIAIVSTGVDPHPEYADRLLEGIGFVGDPNNSLDACGIGTHMAGVVGAAHENMSGTNGIAGVCPTVHILPIRVSNGCQSDKSATAQGIEWAVDRGADIILVGVAFTQGQNQLLQAIEYAASQDVMVVAPAGAVRDNTLSYPAAYANCISVSASTNQDTLAFFSSYGIGLDLAAPGQGIYSTWLNGTYSEVAEAGSISAALTAGTAALLKSYNPGLSSVALRQLMNDTAELIGDPTFFGNGRLCTGCAMRLMPPPPLRFEHDLLSPRVVTPNASSRTTIQLVDVSEMADVDQVFMYYRIDKGPWKVSPVRHLNDDSYELRWPAAPCDSTIEYYLSARSMSGTVILDPATAPLRTYKVRALDRLVLFEDDFESNKGWVVVDPTSSASGLWERVDPVGTSAQPEYDTSPQSGTLCYVTGQHTPGQSVGANDVDGGPVQLCSPQIPMPSRNVELSFSCWVESLGNGVPDVMDVEVSTDHGQSWLMVVQIPSTSGWVRHTHPLRDLVGFTGSSMRLRFSIADFDLSLTEAAVDDVRVTELRCSTASHDDNDDGYIDLTDFNEFFTCFNGPDVPIEYDVCRVFDVYGLLEVDLKDFSAFQRRFNPGM